MNVNNRCFANFLTPCVCLALLVVISGTGDCLHGQIIIRSGASLSSPVVSQHVVKVDKPQAADEDKKNDVAKKAAGDEKATKEEKKPDEIKLELLLATGFNRTPQAILEAWSYREPEVEPKDEPVSLAGKVANAYQGFVVVKLDKPFKFKKDDSVDVTVKDQAIGKLKVLSSDGDTISGQFVEPDAKEGSVEADKNEDSPADKTEKKVEDSLYLSLETGATVELTAAKKKEDAKAKAKQKLQEEVDRFARDVTLGRWSEVKTFLAQLKPKAANKVYTHLLDSLANAIPPLRKGQTLAEAKEQAQEARSNGQKLPTSFLTPEDIIQLTEAAPFPILIKSKKKSDKDASPDKKEAATKKPARAKVKLPAGVSLANLPPEVAAKIKQLKGTVKTDSAKTTKLDTTNQIGKIARIMSNSKRAGHDLAPLVVTIESGTTHFGGEDPAKRLAAATLFFQASMIEEVESFLPLLDAEKTAKDIDVLTLWSKLALRKYGQKKKVVWLDRAWQANQLIARMESATRKDKDEALARLVELSPQIDKEVGAKWLDESFTESTDRGMQILANLGKKSGQQSLNPGSHSSSQRLKQLRLLNKAATQLISLSPDKATEWQQTLTLLADTWTREAEYSAKNSGESSRQANMQIDIYGNYYWSNDDDDGNSWGRGGGRNSIGIANLLEIGPDEAWQKFLASSLEIRLNRAYADLHLKVNEEDKAFPYIEKIAATHPKVARDLVHRFLRSWTKNHDPNDDQRQRNPYIYFYGFDQKADAIPLTRSKQERNLRELAGWVERINKMKLEDIDEQLLANAFTTCHSNAEVFHLDRVRSVFGDLTKLKPETVAAMCQKMRANLIASWRQVKNQEEKQTKRKEPEVQQEVLRGYSVARQLANEALEAAPDNWQLQLALACLMHDENAYSQSVQKSSEFTDRREKAFDQFKIAAEKYAGKVAEFESKKQSTDVFDYWFYASLGACDLGKVTAKTQPKLDQYAKVRDAIESLPGEMAADHMAKFANNLFTRMSPIKPELKFRYLKGGFEIVQDHPRAFKARSLFDYYKDLVSEIQLQVQIDGESNVGHEEPFGAFVNLRHTTEIERESGGFGKYVQNQNSMMWAYNYGRPTEDYRDKFNDSVEQALEDRFEVLSITFESPDTMRSRQDEEAGWRITPYAYLVLKPRGPEVDRLAPLKLDMDFLDTSGYAVIPVESPALVLDASQSEAADRPLANLKVIQTLDERQSSEGKLTVEINASAQGLVPALEDIMDVERDDFEIVSIDDQGVLPSKFDDESDSIAILSDRSWTVEYRAEGDGVNPVSFSFADTNVPDAEVTYQRYEDADLVDSEQQVRLRQSYASVSWSFLYWLIPLIAVGLIALALAVYSLTRKKIAEVKRFQLPSEVNPFTVLSLLKSIKSENGISTEQATDLQQSINRIEDFYFGQTSNGVAPVDLTDVAETWVRRSN